MIQVIRLYPVTIINNFYTNNTINHKDLKFMDLKNMASVIGLDGLELVQYIIALDPQNHKYQE